MEVEVKLFSTLQKGRFQKAIVKLSDGSTAKDLIDCLDILASDVGVLIINGEDAIFNQPLKEGDVVFLIPFKGCG